MSGGARNAVTNAAGAAVRVTAEATDFARRRVREEPTREGDARRQWAALATATATFSGLFWLVAATGAGRPLFGAGAGAYPRAVLVAYLVCVTVGGAAVTVTGGYYAEKLTRSRPAPVAAVAFAVLGFAAGMVPALAVAGIAPGVAAAVPAVLLFAIPAGAAAGVARLAVDAVLRRPGVMLTCWALALAPVGLLLMWAAGLVVAGGAEAARAG